MANPSVDEVLKQVREEFGERFVPARLEAEEEAGQMLRTKAGRMSHDDVVALGDLFNRHEVDGVVKKNRFTPAFTGYSIMRVADRLDELNEALRVLWTGTEDEALRVVGAVLANVRCCPAPVPHPRDERAPRGRRP